MRWYKASIVGWNKTKTTTTPTITDDDGVDDDNEHVSSKEIKNYFI